MIPLTYDKLTIEQTSEQLDTVPRWTIEDGALTRNYHFDSYSDGVVFAGAVAFAAESLNHHPDLLIGYKQVRVSLRTHDAGGGLTAFDFELARRINQLKS